MTERSKFLGLEAVAPDIILTDQASPVFKTADVLVQNSQWPVEMFGK